MDPTITVRLPTRAGRLYQDLFRHKLSFSGSSIDPSKYTLTEPHTVRTSRTTSPMSFPDQSHIDRVRDALWRRTGGGASVMIGAGFSRCARKARPGASDPPTWAEVTRRISDKLYPREDVDDSSPGARNVSSPGDSLKLAQEYESAFGRSDLHDFLRRLIRDDDHEPDEMHRRLLRLPWRDVFTTNWDTLLERTCLSTPERKYTIVRNKDEISVGAPPRVVKLHGSLPSDFPLILTEEDYRTYPRKFAPFVNMAQQAMMETVFCLIGFSGDDPNFLQWSGWVRDNMGKSAPKIYLAGWLDLPTPRRRMLEDRGVVPIDFARHPNANQWPEHLRHHHATDRILYTLEYERSYDSTEWPAPLSGQPIDPPIPDYLLPVTRVDSPKPKKEPEHLSRSLPEDWLKQTETVLDVWSHDRKIYPGWLFVPNSIFFSFNLRTDEWERLILRALPEFVPVHRLSAVRELVWRREISLVPISSDLESKASDVLQNVDCQARTIDGVADTTVRWDEVREAWRHVALALVTAARYAFNRALFDRRLEALSPLLNDDPDVAQRIHHERCLWAIYSMDFRALEGLLADWEMANTDPIWMLRKAAILVEANRVDEAIKLSENAFSHIRQAPDDDRSMAGSSREGWALFWAMAYSMESFWEGKTDSPDRSRFHRRWRELASRKCDALEEKMHLYNFISGQGEKSEPPLFDLNVRRRRGFHVSDEQRRRWVAARRTIRLSEVAGLPPSAFHLSMASDILTLAAAELAEVEPEMAVRLVLRTADYDQDKTLQRVLSRTRVARMSRDSADDLVALCNGVIQYALPQLGNPGVRVGTMSWVERIRVALEVMSRLVLRLDPEPAKGVFDTALNHYQDNHFGHLWLADPLRRLLKRGWETLLPDQQARRIPDLLNAPIVGLDGFKEPFGSHDPDPGHLLTDDLPAPCRAADTEKQWRKIVNLLVRGLRVGGEARKRSAHRIVFVCSWDLLTKSESVEVAQALWDSRYIGNTHLPGETDLADAVFFDLPEPEPGLAERCFRKKWLDVNNPPQGGEESFAEVLWQIGNAIPCGIHRKRSLRLTEEEKSYLAKIAEIWADLPVPRRHIPFVEDQLQDFTRRSIIGLRAILSEIPLPDSTVRKLYGKISELNESEAPGLTLIAGIVRALPDRFDEIVQSMRVGLVSDNPTLAEDAAWGLCHWMQTSNASEASYRKPPIDLVREIGMIVASRKSVSLDISLQVAKWIFDEGTEEQKDAIRELTLQGLGYLFEELRYDRRHERDEDSIPSLRRRCVQLAVSMAKQVFEEASVVSRWLKDAESDPMPEVRYAKVRHAAVFRGDRNGKASGNGEGAGTGTPGGDVRS